MGVGGIIRAMDKGSSMWWTIALAVVILLILGDGSLHHRDSQIQAHPKIGGSPEPCHAGESFRHHGDSGVQYAAA